jgi:opacity protein-like surface antigen
MKVSTCHSKVGHCLLACIGAAAFGWPGKVTFAEETLSEAVSAEPAAHAGPLREAVPEALSAGESTTTEALAAGKLIAGALSSGDQSLEVSASGEQPAERVLEVTIIDPYVDMHTGPGRGYPVVHIIEGGEKTTLLKRRTDWIKIRSERGQTGWAHRDSLRLTLGPREELYQFEEPGIGDYVGRRWSFGFAAGDFGGANSLSANLSYRFSNNLSLEGKVTQATGNFSDSTIVGASLLHETWPEWRVSPYFILGLAVINTSPNATLVQTEDRSDNMMTVGVGAQTYLSRHFVLRLEYTDNLILTSRNDNDEVNEWKLGFNVFF